MFSPPPPHAVRFRSDHLDEIHAFIATYDGNHRRTALGRGPLGYSVHALRCGEVDLGWGQTRVRQTIRGVPQGAILHVPMRWRHVYASNGRTLETRPDTAVLLAAGQDYTLHLEPDDCLIILRIPDAALTEELARRAPASVQQSSGMREIPLAGSRLGALAALQGMLVDATMPAGSTVSTPRTGQLDARLCNWMANQLLGSRPATAAPSQAVRRIRIVEDWIDAHLAEPITLGRLCAVAGVGDRYLESAFRAVRGQTPMQFVQARRLAAVRLNLLESTPGQSVTELAHDVGFVHLGRFAAHYRRAYRESPSVTLRRSLGRY